ARIGATGGIASTTLAPGLSLAISSAAEVVVPTASPLKSGLRQLTQEKSTLPVRSPASLSACVTAPQGTASRITAAKAAASGGVPVRALGPAASAADRSWAGLVEKLNRTLWPFRAHARPMLAPILPEPMIPMFMGSPCDFRARIDQEAGANS